MNWLAVAVAGACGAVARYGLGLAVGPRAFPWTTLGINVAGCLLLAVLVTGPLADRLSTPLGVGVSVGFLGAFTTFSTFGNETVALVRDGRAAAALVYVAASLVLGLGATAAGYLFGTAIWD